MVTCPGCGSSADVQILPEVGASDVPDPAQRWTRWAARCDGCHESWVFNDQPQRVHR